MTVFVLMEPRAATRTVGISKSKMLFSECYEFCVVHEEEEVEAALPEILYGRGRGWHGAEKCTAAAPRFVDLDSRAFSPAAWDLTQS